MAALSERGDSMDDYAPGGGGGATPKQRKGEEGSGKGDTREARMMKRKQANRDSARRSKQRKKQEVELLGHEAKDLVSEVEQLRHQVHEAEARVARLQQARQELVNQAALAQS